VVSVLDGLEVLDDGLRQNGLELTPRHVTDLREDVLLGSLGGLDGRENVEQVGGFRSLRIVPLDALEGIRFAPLDLVADGLGIVQDVDSGAVRGVALGHLGSAVREAHDAGPLLENNGIGFDKDRPGRDAGRLAALLVLVSLAKQVVEPTDNVSCQFQVLPLVLANRDLGGLVEHNVGGHENGVGEETDTDGFALLFGLFLELDHALQPVHRRDAVEQPGKLGMGRDMGLDKDFRLGRIDSCHVPKRDNDDVLVVVLYCIVLCFVAICIPIFFSNVER